MSCEPCWKGKTIMDLEKQAELLEKDLDCLKNRVEILLHRIEKLER